MKTSMRKGKGMWAQKNKRLLDNTSRHPASRVHSVETQKGVADSSLTKRAEEVLVTKEEFEMLMKIQQASKGGY